jgi:transcriptional regulator with XRE-family HTH domain
MELYSRVCLARRSGGLTQSTLAGLVGVTRSAVANWEIENRPNPCTAHLERIALVTGVSFEWLATGRGEMYLSPTAANVVPLAEMTRTAQERRLLLDFRKVPEDARAMLLGFLSEQIAHSAERR